MSAGLDGPLLKYFNSQPRPGDVPEGAKYLWPGTPDGVPILSMSGQAPMLKKEELEDLPLVGDFKFHEFKLWEPEDREYYREVKDRIANGMYFKQHEDRHYDPATGHRIVYVEWLQIHGIIPSEYERRRGPQGQDPASSAAAQPEPPREVAVPVAIPPVSDNLGNASQSSAALPDIVDQKLAMAMAELEFMMAEPEIETNVVDTSPLGMQSR